MLQRSFVRVWEKTNKQTNINQQIKKATSAAVTTATAITESEATGLNFFVKVI